MFKGSEMSLVDPVCQYLYALTSGKLESRNTKAGGIKLSQVDPQTMASRIVSGLSFCGEILDIEADSGGFNLQAAFSTGWLTGTHAAK